MNRKSFSDIVKKKGFLGDTVIEVSYGEERGEKKTIKDIISKGKNGTRIYFEEGGYGPSTNYRVINRGISPK